MNVPEDLRYTDSHEWIQSGEETAKVGLTDHAQSELSDVVYVELPEAGRTVSAKEAVAVVESVKAASDIYAPVAGEIVEVNAEVGNDPAVINTDPFGGGWLFKIKVADPGEVDGLLDPEAYKALIG